MFPTLVDIYETLTGEGEDYYYVTIDVFEDQGAHDAYVTGQGFEYTAAFWSTDDSIYTAGWDTLCGYYGLDNGYIPENFIVDRDGYVRAADNTISGPDWESKIRELLGENFE